MSIRLTYLTNGSKWRLSKKRGWVAYGWSMCDICFCIFWPEQSQHASSHIDRFDSPVDVRYLLLYLLARKITTCIIAHRPIRFVSIVATKNCAISGHYKNQISNTDRESNRSMCDIVVCDFTGQALQNQYRTPTKNRIGRCAMRVLWVSGQEVHKPISHTDQESNRSMCDMCLVIFLADRYTNQYRTPTIVATKIERFQPLLNEDHHHTWVLEFGQDITDSFSKSKWFKRNCDVLPKFKYSLQKDGINRTVASQCHSKGFCTSMTRHPNVTDHRRYSLVWWPDTSYL